jgi:cobalamin biosynthesis Co2+ chelatase CbiK
MNREKLVELYKKYELTKDDVYKHKMYVIITRQGIEKIQAKEKIVISYEVIKCETNFAVIKAVAVKENMTIETFGSALKGEGYKDGNCQSFYVAEMAEKRALSRSVLKLTGFYELGVFSEDESDDFKNKN